MAHLPVTETPKIPVPEGLSPASALAEKPSGNCAGGTCPPPAPFYSSSPKRSRTPALGRGGRAAVPQPITHGPRGFSRFFSIAGPILGDLLGALALFVILFAGLFLEVILS